MKNMLGLVNNEQPPQPQKQQPQKQQPRQPQKQEEEKPQQKQEGEQINNKDVPITPEIVEKMNIFYKLNILFMK